ncbi:MAG: hypothetical protein IJH47_04295 [Oscillospiraceae bacterium]|nr:hypothetical protein [Oscillospiraceae bacterium]
MKCFFRSLATWEHLAAPDVVSYAVPVFAASKKTGTVKVAGETPGLSGCWAVLDGRLFYASKAAPASGYTTVTLSKPIYAFTRDLVYGGDGTEDLEDFIAAELTANWVDQEDEQFAMPYLTVTTGGTTAADMAFSHNEVYPFTEVLELAEEMGVDFTWTMFADSLSLTLAPRSTGAHNVFFNDGHSQLLSVSVTTSLVAKVTARRIAVEDDVITVSATKNFYWHADGSITETPPSPRIPGTWAVVSVTDEDLDLDVAAAEAMASNNSSVKITFASDREFRLGDRITCRVNGEVITAAVTSAQIQNTDPRTRYELGNLPTTLTEKYEAAGAVRREQAVTYENSVEKPISSAGGTVGGSLTVNESLKANVLAVTSNSYGTTLPATGVVGQIFFLLQ